MLTSKQGRCLKQWQMTFAKNVSGTTITDGKFCSITCQSSGPSPGPGHAIAVLRWPLSVVTVLLTDGVYINYFWQLCNFVFHFSPLVSIMATIFLALKNVCGAQEKS